jgi:quinol-cytochrome oxidoreductase complex cytochrome b subunit/mono/diheme cytochrome c family protein
MRRILDWLDHRAGVRSLVGMMLLEGVPGGARWRYVWGSCLAFVFSLQVITGVLLMTAYSPSESQAWNSVHTIQYKMDFGWLIRGLHHFGSQTMMVLIALHMLQVVIAGAHLPPREINWWTGIGLLSVTLGLSLTGYLLPWDQKGYWATDVATNIAGTLPQVGAEVKQQAVAGPDSGNLTLTRFYGLHVAILPGTLIVLLAFHIYVFRRHGVTSKENPEGIVNKPENEHAPGSESFWPRQAFFDMVACMIVFAVMLSLVLYGFAHKVEVPEQSLYESIARAGVHGKGAELDAAADRDTAGYPARPEWYFLFLFQLLKYFPGDYAIFGTVIIPNGVMLVLFLLPLFGIGPLRKVGHFFGMLFVVTLLIVVGLLTLRALDDDRPDGILWGLMKDKSDSPEAKKAREKAEDFQHKQHEAEILAKRACQLAMPGAPVEGGHFLIRNDPYTTGREVFRQKCGTCHAFTAQDGDKFVRTFMVDVKLQPHLEKVDLAEIQKEFQKKGAPLSKKLEVKPVNVGQEWQINDGEYDRSYVIALDHGKLQVTTKSITDGVSASDLGDWGRESWVRGLIQNPMHNKFFGLVKTEERDGDDKIVLDDKGKKILIPGLVGMRGWRQKVEKARVAKKNPVNAGVQEKEFDAIARWLAYLAKPQDERKDDKIIEEGQAAFFKDASNSCQDCHRAEKRVKEGKKFKWIIEGSEDAPDLTGWGSAEWLRSMIVQPAHNRSYGQRNLMPAFRAQDSVGSDLFLKSSVKSRNDTIAPLSDVEREMIIRWMLRDYRPVFGGAGIAK